jgi:hypothetical protein
MNARCGALMNGFDTVSAAFRQRHGERLITVLAALLAFLMFVGAPLVAFGSFTFHLVGGVTILAMSAVAFVLNGKPYVLIPMVLAFALSASAEAMRAASPSPLDMYLSASAWLILSAMWAWIVAPIVFGPGRVTYHRIIGAVFLYLLVAMVFACLYMIIGAGNPKAFTGLVVEDTDANAAHLIYFSLVTLTTAGYGDIAPLDPFARALTNLESAFGALYPATLIARLVSLEIEGRSKGGTHP